MKFHLMHVKQLAKSITEGLVDQIDLGSGWLQVLPLTCRCQANEYSQTKV